MALGGVLAACGAPDRVFQDAPTGGASSAGATSVGGNSAGATSAGGSSVGGSSVGGSSAGDGAGGLGAAGGGGRTSCDLGEDSVEHCGACDRSCPAPAREDEQAVCVAGECKTRCIEGASRCGSDGKVRIECIEGVFQYAGTCDFVCVDGSCDGSCSPGDTGCSGKSVTLCGEDGEWAVTTPCAFACLAGECTGVCVPEQTRCGAAGREICDDLGEWEVAPCGSGTECVAGACLKSDGQTCAAAAECASDDCTTFYLDADKDGYGSTGTVKVCGATPPSGYVSNDDDCCDSDAAARPGQEEFFSRVRTGCGGYDFDCNDDEELERELVSTGCGSTSEAQTMCRGWHGTPPGCGDEGQYFTMCECTYSSQSGCHSLCPRFDASVQACR